MVQLARARKLGRKFQNPVETSVGGFSTMWKVLPLYIGNREETTPRSPLGPFSTDSSIYQKPPASRLRVTWFGHSSLFIEMSEMRVLIDPVWDNRASPSKWFGPKRFFQPPIALKDLPPIDLVLISHDHYDHLGIDTVVQLASIANGARWVTSLGVGSILRQAGVPGSAITELDWTESISIGELSVTALPSRHFSGRGLGNRFETLWSSFVLRDAFHTIYYGADSGWWDGFAEIGRQYGPFDLTMLEIGAFHELWQSIHLGPDGAARAFTALGGHGLLMPIHWGLFNLALHGWRQPIQRITSWADQTGTLLWSPAPGTPSEVHAGQELRSDWWR